MTFLFEFFAWFNLFFVLTYFCFLTLFQFLHTSDVFKLWGLFNNRVHFGNLHKASGFEFRTQVSNSDLGFRIRVIIILIIIKTVLACLLWTKCHSFRHSITQRAGLLEHAARIGLNSIVWRIVWLMIFSNDFEQSGDLVKRSVLGLRHAMVCEGPEDGYKPGEWQKWIRFEHTLWRGEREQKINSAIVEELKNRI